MQSGKDPRIMRECSNFYQEHQDVILISNIFGAGSEHAPATRPAAWAGPEEPRHSAGRAACS